MRVLFINQRQIGVDVGGAESSSALIAQYLVGRGVEVFFAQMARPTHDGDEFFIDRTRLFCLESMHRLEEYILDHMIDVIINHDGFNFELNKLLTMKVRLGVPVITVLHSEPFFQIKARIYALKSRGSVGANFGGACRALVGTVIDIFRLALIVKRSSRIITLSKHYTGQLLFLERLLPRPKARILNISNAVDLMPSHNRLDSCGIDQTVLSIGRLHPGKRVSDILYAWRCVEGACKGWALKIVGGGGEDAALRELSSDLSLESVIFCGETSNPAQYYQSASIIVMASAYEGFPMVLVEAMSFGVVPVLYKSFAAAEDLVVDGINGLLIENGNIDELSRKLRWLIESRISREEMSKQCRLHVIEYELDRIGEKWDACLRELVEETGGLVSS